MIVVDNALLEIEPEEKELLWEAIIFYYGVCIDRVNEGHFVAEIFKQRKGQCEKFISKAGHVWGRWYP